MENKLKFSEVRMRRINGHLLIAIGILHNAVGFLLGFNYLAEIASDGFLNAVEPHFPRMAIFWFLFTGFLFIILGQLCHWVERKLNQPIPSLVGWELLVLSIIGAAMMPASGFWLVIALALYMIYANKRPAAQAVDPA